MTDKLSFLFPPETYESQDPEPSYSREAPSQPPGSASSSNPLPPPPFSSLYFPPASTPYHSAETYVTEPDPSSLPAFAPAPPFDSLLSGRTSVVEAEVKAALPRDTKGEPSGKGLEDGEPPPPYTEGSSPLEGFTYVMAAADGAASILTQVQQGGPAPVNTLGGMSITIMFWSRLRAVVPLTEAKQMLVQMSTSPWIYGMHSDPTVVIQQTQLIF